MSPEIFEQFRHLVLQDVTLQEKLRGTTDRRSFVDLVVQVGAERGYRFTPADVEAAMSANRRLWLQQRIVS